MKHIKHVLIIALLGVANFVTAADDSFQPQIIKGRIVQKRTGMPVPNCPLWIRYFTEDAGREVQVFSVAYGCSDNGEFAITNLLDQVSRCDIELNERNKYQEPSISGSFEPGINDWGTFKVSVRPFYFKSCWQDHNMVSATVVNTTGKKAYMRFWLTGQLTRLDDSEYLGCNSEIPLQLKQGKKGYMDFATYQLVPGENNIELRVRDYGPNLSVSGIMLSGGRSLSEPMMPSTRVFQMIVLPPTTNTLPPFITNLPPIRITNFPPIITNFPPIIPVPFPTNLPPIYPISGIIATLDEGSGLILSNLHISITNHLLLTNTYSRLTNIYAHPVLPTNFPPRIPLSP